MSGHYLELSTNPLRFEAIGKSTNVFFDEANRQVFAVVGGSSDIAVTSWENRKVMYIRVPDRGPVLSIKFAPDQRTLAIQRSTQVVDFVNLSVSTDATAYSQQCRGKTTEVRSFHWTSSSEIIFVTNQGVEFYQVLPERRSLKLIKSYNISVNWFVFSCEKNVLLLSTTQAGNVVCPFHFRSNQVLRLPRFEVDLPPSKTKTTGLRLHERDVTMAVLYNQLYVVVVRHQPRSLGLGAEVVLYALSREVVARRTAILKVDMTGRFAINTTDNLLIVHHQASKTSAVFDIKFGGDYDGQISTHHSVLAALPIAPVSVEPSTSSKDLSSLSCELYSANWVVFQPNIIIDARLGCMWEIHVKLETLVTMMPDKKRLIDFLLLRLDSKRVILDVCKQGLVPGRQASLSVIARVFDTLNAVYKEHMQKATAAQARAADGSVTRGSRRRSLAGSDSLITCVIDQHDMYKHVFSQVVDIKSIQNKFMVAVIVEYIRSLNTVSIPVQHFLYELVIKLLVESKQFYQLHQFLQYHVLSDSKPLACLMLSLESIYPPAFQLALDMLKRLATANDDIVDVLLSKSQLIPALRFLRSMGREDNVSARLFLETAASSGDNMLFYSVFKFFEERNLRIRRRPEFVPGDHCDEYVGLFYSIFNADGTEKAVDGPS